MAMHSVSPQLQTNLPPPQPFLSTNQTFPLINQPQSQQPLDSDYRSVVRGLVVVNLVHNIYSIFIVFGVFVASCVLVKVDYFHLLAVIGIICSCIFLVLLGLSIFWLMTHVWDWTSTSTRRPALNYDGGDCGWTGLTVVIILGECVTLIILFAVDALTDLFIKAFFPIMFSISLRIASIVFVERFRQEMKYSRDSHLVYLQNPASVCPAPVPFQGPSQEVRLQGIDINPSKNLSQLLPVKRD